MRRSRALLALASAAVSLLLGGARLAAQQLPSLPSLPERRGIRLNGEISALGELYRNTGDQARRPGETGRLHVDLNAALFGSLNVGINLLISSEDGTSAGYGGLPGRQRIGEFGLHPQWGWGRGHLGTFSDALSPFTYSGVRLTGAAFDINPGLLRLAAFGGRARSAVVGGASNGSYRRGMYGGKVGIGRKSAWEPGTYFDVMVVRTWDDPTSLPAPVDTTLPPNSPAAVAGNQFALTPQENLVASTVGGLALFGKKVSLRSELAVSAHTLDRRATPLDESETDNYPGFLRSLMKPRVGTHLDHAFSSDLQFRLPRLPGATQTSPRTLTATLGYRYVGPGYVSLGSASLLNDVREYRLRTSTRFRRWSLQLDGSRQSDNLIGQKLATTTRYRVGGAFTLHATRHWNLTLRGNHLTMGNGIAAGDNQLDYRSTMLGASQSLLLRPGQRVEQVSFDYTYQQAGDANPLRTSSEFLSSAFDFRASVKLRANIRMTPTVGFTSFRVGTDDRRLRATFGTSAVWSALHGRLTTTAALSNSRYAGTNALSGSLRGRLQVTGQDELSVAAQTSRFREWSAANNYNETVFSVRWTRSFSGGR